MKSHRNIIRTAWASKCLRLGEGLGMEAISFKASWCRWSLYKQYAFWKVC